MEKWQQLLSENFRSMDELREAYALPNSVCPFPKFPLNIPKRLADKIETWRETDPIFLQYVPLAQELVNTPGFEKDPVEDCSFQKERKLLHKYPGRALLLLTSACAMHCRYCFRQHFPYEKSASEYEEELAYIESTPSIHEVILSGGDPLAKSDRALNALLQKLSTIDHVKVIRFHSKFIIGIPERVTPSFLAVLKACKKQLVFTLHCNHAKELDSDVADALKKIASLGIPLLNQTVLLQGVNNTSEIMQALCLRLIECGVIPYYLHQFDRVQGGARFEVPVEDGLALITKLRKMVPGYAVPQYVQEIPGKESKTPLHSIESLEPQDIHPTSEYPLSDMTELKT